MADFVGQEGFLRGGCRRACRLAIGGLPTRPGSLVNQAARAVNACAAVAASAIARPGLSATVAYERIKDTNRELAIAAWRAQEHELRADGVESASLFGSVARGENLPDSDIDIAVRLGDSFSRGFQYFERLEALESRLAHILDRKVDVVEEPARKERLQRAIEKDRAMAF